MPPGARPCARLMPSLPYDPQQESLKDEHFAVKTRPVFSHPRQQDLRPTKAPGRSPLCAPLGNRWRVLPAWRTPEPPPHRKTRQHPPPSHSLCLVKAHYTRCLSLLTQPLPFINHSSFCKFLVKHFDCQVQYPTEIMTNSLALRGV